MYMMNVNDFILGYQTRWEGKMSRDANDAGNWSSGKKGLGTLVGSNIGITATPLAAYRKVPLASITMADMAKLTQAEAGQIALSLYYTAPGFNLLPWNPVTASVMDFGFNAGPGRAIRVLQDLLNCKDVDGKIGAGGETVKLFAAFCAKSLEFAAGAWWAMREEFYEDLVASKPSNGIYLNGWDNRSDYFTPGHSEGWWNRFISVKG